MRRRCPASFAGDDVEQGKPAHKAWSHRSRQFLPHTSTQHANTQAKQVLVCLLNAEPPNASQTGRWKSESLMSKVEVGFPS